MERRTTSTATVLLALAGAAAAAFAGPRAEAKDYYANTDLGIRLGQFDPEKAQPDPLESRRHVTLNTRHAGKTHTMRVAVPQQRHVARTPQVMGTIQYGPSGSNESAADALYRPEWRPGVANPFYTATAGG